MRWLLPLGTLLAFSVMLALTDRNPTPLLPLQPPAQNAPRVQTDQKPQSAVNNQQNANSLGSDSLPTRTPATGLPSADNPRDRGNHRSEEGTEFWPSFFGVRLKITDSLLALFTLLLAMFTYRLWKVTERALTDLERPWLFVVVMQRLGGYPAEDDEWPSVVFTVLNGGRFPAEIIECRADFIQTAAAPIGTLRPELHTIVSPDQPMRDARLGAAAPFEYDAPTNPYGRLRRITPKPSSLYETVFVIKMSYRGLGKDIYISYSATITVSGARQLG